MNYSQRITLTIALSLLAHLALVASWRGGQTAPVAPQEPPAITVHLREDPIRFVDVHTPADTPPEDADLIAVHDARAAAMDHREEVTDETAPGPPPETPDLLDVAARVPTTSQEPRIESAPQPASPSVDTAPQEPAPPQTAREKEPEPSEPHEDAERIAVARATPPQPAPETARREPAPPAPAAAEQAMPPQEFRARSRGRTVTHGVTNFEALQHEIAPYLKHIRDKVEQRWREALFMRYTGTSPARAEVFCAIAPDGTLVEARIVGMGDDPIFAGICRDAIERAAPFGPFPFDPPDIYRNQNLEINWHFSFL